MVLMDSIPMSKRPTGIAKPSRAPIMGGGGPKPKVQRKSKVRKVTTRRRRVY